MYRVEIYERCRLIEVAVYEKLENAIYDSTHVEKGLFNNANEKRQYEMNNMKIEARILNDEFIFRWKCGVEVIIRKMMAKDSKEMESHLLYEGNPCYEGMTNDE